MIIVIFIFKIIGLLFIGIGVLYFPILYIKKQKLEIELATRISMEKIYFGSDITKLSALEQESVSRLEPLSEEKEKDLKNSIKNEIRFYRFAITDINSKTILIVLLIIAGYCLINLTDVSFIQCLEVFA